MSSAIPYKLRDWIDQDKLDWDALSINPNAVHLLEQNQDKINWLMLSKNPNAVELLEQNPQKIDWYQLCTNPNAIHLLEQNQDKIDSYWISLNPSIFVYDYQAMRESHRDLKEELMQAAWHPSRVAKWLEAGMDIDEL
jgi:hypothetical protein